MLWFLGPLPDSTSLAVLPSKNPLKISWIIMADPTWFIIFCEKSHEIYRGDPLIIAEISSYLPKTCLWRAIVSTDVCCQDEKKELNCTQSPYFVSPQYIFDAGAVELRILCCLPRQRHGIEPGHAVVVCLIFSAMLFCSGWLRKAKLFSSTASWTLAAAGMGRRRGWREGLDPRNGDLDMRSLFHLNSL